jgi:hypothetical protein
MHAQAGPDGTMSFGQKLIDLMSVSQHIMVTSVGQNIWPKILASVEGMASN